MDYRLIAKRVVKDEAHALEKLTENIPADFDNLVNHILSIKGRVILLGMGKSGHIAKKIAASLASTGTPAFFIHPAEASHGDLGMITEDDLVIMLSNSGETQELFDTINYCIRFNIPIASMTMKENSTLGRNATYLLQIPTSKEVSSISAPTTSALIMLSLGDAIVTCLHEAKGFTKEQFKNFHPGGKIGANLLKVKDLMYELPQLPIVRPECNFNELIITITEKRLGCALIVNNNNDITGIVTDGDLRRHINGNQLHSLQACDIMTKKPIFIEEDALASEALYLMNNKGITILPVKLDKKLVGAIHIHDILKAGVT